MHTTQITLTDSANEALEVLSQLKGKKPEELLQEAVEQMLEPYQQENRLAALRQARDLWKDRDDLPTLEELRSEWNRV